MDKLSYGELKQRIADRVYDLATKNNEINDSKQLISPLTAQIAVYATLDILEELGFITLPKKD